MQRGREVREAARAREQGSRRTELQQQVPGGCGASPPPPLDASALSAHTHLRTQPARAREQASAASTCGTAHAVRASAMPSRSTPARTRPPQRTTRRAAPPRRPPPSLNGGRRRRAGRGASALSGRRRLQAGTGRSVVPAAWRHVCSGDELPRCGHKARLAKVWSASVVAAASQRSHTHRRPRTCDKMDGGGRNKANPCASAALATQLACIFNTVGGPAVTNGVARTRGRIGAR
jgi:hypothetical protein